MNHRIQHLVYFLQLGVSGLARNRLLTALMVVAIGLGIGAFMTTYNLYHMMSSDPLPDRSERLYNLRMDVVPIGHSGYDTTPDRLPPLMTWQDSRALLEDAPVPAVTAHFRSWVALKPDRSDVKSAIEYARVASADFFGMFGMRFVHGSGWTRAQETAEDRVAVIDTALSERLFGRTEAVGETVVLDNEPFRVIGVVEPWQPVPRVHDVVNGAFDDTARLFIPISLTEPMELNISGQRLCPESPGEGFGGFLRSNCIWTGLWVELPDPAAKARFEAWLESYIDEQHAQGRFQNSQRYALQPVREWLAAMNVVGEDTPMILAAAFLFLLVCLINTIALLLAKFLARTRELGIRRALGATRGAIFGQHLSESLMLGLLGAALGLAMTWIGLRALDALYSDMSRLVALSWPVIAMTIAAAVISALLVGIYPAWRAARILPAAQIRAA